MLARTHHYSDVAEYEAIEESSPHKHEYYNGSVFVMAGASIRHNRITRNIASVLQNKLRGSSCEAFGSDLRIRTPGGLWTYPDASVICGPLEIHKQGRLETALNPRLLVEVLSDSTRDYDKTDKFALYREISSFCEYLMIEQDTITVERHTLDPHLDRTKKRSWKMRRYTNPEEPIELLSLSLTISLTEIYEQTGLL